MICISLQEKSLKGCLDVIERAREIKCAKSGAFGAGMPLIELRADLCKLPLADLEKIVEAYPNLLITCRIENSSIDFAREQIITALRKGAKFVDIEIEAPVDFLEYVKAYAQVNGAKVIVSYHNFEGTQSAQELELIADICKRKGADIVKIVTTAHTISDAVRTLGLYKRGNWAKELKSNNYSEVKDVMLLAFSMGKAGQFSRYLSLMMGAPYTYVAAEEGSATAPGQYTLGQMQKLLEKGFIELDYKLGGNSVTIPCSKSVAQRAILAAAFAEGKSTLSNFEPCNDINGAVEVIGKLGCKTTLLDGNILEIESPGAEAIRRNLMYSIGKECRIGEECNNREETSNKGKTIFLETGESGLLTRLLLPFAAYLTADTPDAPDSADHKCVKIVGRGSILGRNLKGAAEALKSAGAECTATNGGYLPFEVTGTITERNIRISGKESSQTVSGFLMTLPLLPFDTRLEIVEPASIPYIDLTLDAIEKFGISINKCEATENLLVFSIKGGQRYTPCNLYMEPDWSSASFFAVAYAIAAMEGGEFWLKDMVVGTSQADEAVLKVLESAGVKIEVILSGRKEELSDINIKTPQGLNAFDFDATNAPDLFPILTVLALFCKGTSSIKGVGRLLEKESNRAESIFTEFTALGADLEIVDDYLYIKGNMPDLDNEDVVNLHSHNDHRIAMSLIVASLFMGKKMVLDQISCIDKSFPSFLSRL